MGCYSGWKEVSGCEKDWGSIGAKEYRGFSTLLWLEQSHQVGGPAPFMEDRAADTELPTSP